MKKITIKKFNINQINADILSEVKNVFAKAYHNGHMYEDFINDIKSSPKIFKVFFAYSDNKIIGIVVIESQIHKFIEYFNFQPVHIKRFTVLPNFRSKGVGKMLLDEAKKHTFKELNIPVIFGKSNEAGALSFYGKEDALYSTETIKNYSRRNSPNENITFFKLDSRMKRNF